MILLGVELPLAWTPGPVDGVSAIEVYPAATLATRGLPSTGYKGPDAAAARRSMLSPIADEIEIPRAARKRMVAVDHVFDAVVCVLAAVDFLRAPVIPVPVDERSRVRREGWIWVRRPRAVSA